MIIIYIHISLRMVVSLPAYQIFRCANTHTHEHTTHIDMNKICLFMYIISMYICTCIHRILHFDVNVMKNYRKSITFYDYIISMVFWLLQTYIIDSEVWVNVILLIADTFSDAVPSMSMPCISSMLLSSPSSCWWHKYFISFLME